MTCTGSAILKLLGSLHHSMTNEEAWCRQQLEKDFAQLYPGSSPPSAQLRTRRGRPWMVYRDAAHITSIAPVTIASNSLRGTRARARIAMVWVVADASCASTLGSAASDSSPFSLAMRKQAANALSSSENPSSTMARISGSKTASDAAVITVKQPRGPASPER